MARKRSKADRHVAALKGWRTRRKNEKENTNARKIDKTRSPKSPTIRKRSVKPIAKNKNAVSTGNRKRSIPVPGKSGKGTKRLKFSPQQRGAIARARNKAAEHKRRSEAAKLGWARRRHKKAEAPNQE